MVDIPCRAKGNLVGWLEGGEVPPDLQPLPSLMQTVLKSATLSPLSRVSLAISRHPRKQTGKITVISGLEINPVLP